MKPMPAHAAAPPATFDTIVKPFLAENCFACHGNKKQKKELNFESFTSVATLIDDRGPLGRGRACGCAHREMPPDDEPQPAEHQRQAVAGLAGDRELARIDRVTPPDPGRVTARRLNRAEYNNTIRRSARRRHAAGRRFPAGRFRLRLRQHRRRAVALAGADGEVHLGGRQGRAHGALRPADAHADAARACDPTGAASRRGAACPGDYDVTGLSLPNAFHAIHRVPVEGEYVVAGRRWAARGPPVPSRSPWRSGSTSARSRTRARSGGRRDVRRRPAGLRRPDDRVPRPAAGGRSPASRGDPAHLRRAARRATAGRTRRRGPSRPRRRSSRRPTRRPSGSRAAQALRRDAGGARRRSR